MTGYTYQDLAAVGEGEKERMNFCIGAINRHQSSEEFKMAQIAAEYDAQRNTTIMNYQKLLYTISGKAVPDNYTANHKCASNFFHRFVTQRVQYLLGNGVSFEDENAKTALGGDNFDLALKKVAKAALIAGAAFGFYNLGTVTIFKITEFVPFYDEEDGALKAGVRFWQIDPKKPLRFTLYEMDGYTEYIRRSGEEPQVMAEKRAYIQTVQTEGTGETEIIDGANYPGFPIVPIYGNEYKESMLTGMRENIDCYDLIKSGFANDLDDASMIYWTLENAGGMDDVDLAKFDEGMETGKAAVIDGDAGAKAEAHTLDVPSASRTAYLERLEADLYRDAMALNTNTISAGNITATAINAAYDPLEESANDLEDQVCAFVNGLLTLAGYTAQEKYSFKRTRIANQQEETNLVLSAAQFLDHETILRHLPFLAADEIPGILERTTREEAERYTDLTDEEEEEELNG